MLAFRAMAGGWKAFFFTFAWLRSRRMRAWAWAYLPFSTPFLLALWILVFATSDACRRALEGWGPAAAAALGILLAIGWIAPPFALRRLGDRGPAARLWPALLGQLAIVAVPAVLAPSYASYSYRARVSEALREVSPLRTAVTEALMARETPEKTAALARGFRPSKLVKRVEVAGNGAIRATLGAGSLEDRTVLYEPVSSSDWRCRSDDLPDACLPAACRR